MRIDHVIYAAADLAVATDQIADRLGLEPAGGGRHDGIGTHNEIFGFGGGYLEVLAVADDAEASVSGIGRALQARLAASGDGLWSWAVAVEDIAHVCEHLGTEVTTIGRSGMTAQLTGVVEAMTTPGLPFFIARDAGVADPGAGGGAGGITWLEVSTDPAALERWLGTHEMPLRVSAGDGGVTGVGIGDSALR